MSVELWSGTPGSGKSLHVAKDIRDNLRCGKYVISTCNIDTDLCFMNKLQEFIFNVTKGKLRLTNRHDERAKHFSYVPNEFMTVEYLYDFAARYHIAGKEKQTYLYLDECVALFSPTVIGDNKELWNKWDNFFRLHRHLGYEIILVPQSKRLISRKVIEYAETEVKHYNRKYQGNFGFFLSLFLGGLFSYKVCWRGDKVPIEQHFFTYKPFYGQMYNSYSMFDTVLSPYKAAWHKKQVYLAQLCKLLRLRQEQLQSEEL